MRTIERKYTRYTLAELTPQAHTQAYEDWLRSQPEYAYGDNNKTLEAFCNLLGVHCPRLRTAERSQQA